MGNVTASLQSRDLLSAGDLTRDEYECVFATATSLKGEFRKSRRHEAQPLAGRNVALIFEKQSLRTRVTFEAGLNQLGGHALHLGDGIGFRVRESVSDIARNLDRWITIPSIQRSRLRAMSETLSRTRNPIPSPRCNAWPPS